MGARILLVLDSRHVPKKQETFGFCSVPTFKSSNPFQRLPTFIVFLLRNNSSRSARFKATQSFYWVTEVCLRREEQRAEHGGGSDAEAVG